MVWTAFLSLPAIIGLAACVSVLPEPEAPGGLYSVSAADQRVALSDNVVIREFEAPELVGGMAMVAEGPDGARRLVRSVEWSGRLTREMQMALIDSFDPNATGTALLPELGVSAPYRMVGRIQTLLLRGEVAECVATVSVTDGAARNLIGQQTVRATARAERDRGPERAQALKAAAESCVQELARATANILDMAEASERAD
ncbi:MAG: ABC-type transport auxiliary lipoprotein family protein [Pseudomonadota bacterium]